MKREEYYHGKPGTKYGIWNTVKKQFQFGICEDTPALAEARLFQKIGNDARKWRFEPRRLQERIPTQDVSRRATLPSDTPKTHCEYCAPLITCPVGEKRKVYICGDRTHDLTEMVLDKYKDHTDVFIHTEYGNDGFYHNTAFDIEYCPFCGTQLKYAPSYNQEVEANEKS